MKNIISIFLKKSMNKISHKKCDILESNNDNHGNYYYFGNKGRNNKGNCNIGNCNIGNGNNGNYNIGCCNIGDCNNGNYNIGDNNIGICNIGNCNNGCFNTNLPKMYFFNKLSDWTYYDWLASGANFVMMKYPSNEAERQTWWNSLPEKQKEAVMQLPNFDKNIFKEITGIIVD